MSLPKAVRVCAVAFMSSVGVSLGAGSATAGPVLIELFTSQGCSSCPPADALFAEYADRDDVIALSLPVDYWNYLGWEDTLAQRAHTQRQYGYAATRGDNQVYTPQIVVAGTWHVVGSDRAAIETAIAAAEGMPSVDLAIVSTDGGLQVEVGPAVNGAPTYGTLWLVMFDDAATVEIGRGENAGRSVTYHHVVLEMHGLAMWRGEAMSIELAMMELTAAGADGCVVILQQHFGAAPGQVIAAASYTLPR